MWMKRGDLTREEELLVLAAARGGCLGAVNMIVHRARKRPINPNVDERRYVEFLIRAAQPGKLKRAPKRQRSSDASPVGAGGLEGW